jgi:hypothetical protein
MEKVFAINNRKKTKKLAQVAEILSILSSAPLPGGETVFRRCEGLCFICGDPTDGAHNAKDGSA